MGVKVGTHCDVEEPLSASSKKSKFQITRI